jgi:hypothetical protein
MRGITITAELHRLEGELLLIQGGNEEQAAMLFRKPLEIAHS